MPTLLEIIEAANLRPATTTKADGGRVYVTTRRAALESFNREARQHFPSLDLPRATVAFMATQRGRALHAAYKAADPNPVDSMTKEAPRTEAEILAETINDQIEAIAKSESVSLAEALSRFVRTPGGQLMTRGYRRARGIRV